MKKMNDKNFALAIYQAVVEQQIEENQNKLEVLHEKTT
jgi:hypothetical protein